MKIETEFDIGETVYIVNSCLEVQKEEITCIKVWSDGISYNCQATSHCESFSEGGGRVFKTSKEAIDKALEIKRNQIEANLEEV